MSETSMVTVLGMSGSLRKGSFNTGALRAAVELVPEGMKIETADLRPLPHYDDDVRLQAYPPVVQQFRDRIKAADAILFVTPEYNYSISGVLKNAIDWASRPPDQPFNWKPCAIISASGSLLGGVRAQYHLRHMCVSLNCFPLNNPQVYITEAPKKFDAEGRLTDQAARDLIRQLLTELKRFAVSFRPLAGSFDAACVPDPVALGVAALCVFLGGVVKGVAALGLPLVAIPLLAWVVGLKTAVPLLVVPMIGSNLVQSFQGGLFLYNLRRFWLLELTVLVFALVGTRLLVHVPQRALAFAIGVALVVLPLVIHYRPALTVSARQRRWADPLVGAIAGLLGGIAAYYGPPIMLYMLGLRLAKEEFVSAISLLYCIASAGIFVGVLSSGAASPAMLGLSALMLLPVGLGMWLGQRVQVRLSEHGFRRLLMGVYLATGASFLVQAAL